VRVPENPLKKYLAKKQISVRDFALLARTDVSQVYAVQRDGPARMPLEFLSVITYLDSWPEAKAIEKAYSTRREALRTNLMKGGKA